MLFFSTAKSNVTTSYLLGSHLGFSPHTWGLRAPLLLSWLEFFDCHENEIWRWYTIWDENPDRDRDKAAKTKDISLFLTASQWHTVAWNTVYPALFSGGTTHAAKFLYFLPECHWITVSYTVMLPKCGLIYLFHVLRKSKNVKYIDLTVDLISIYG